jgi:hypothetical protein
VKAVKFKIKVPADLVPGEGSLPGLQIAAFLLCSWAEWGGGGSLVSLILLDQSSTFIISLNFIYSKYSHIWG